MAIIIPVIFSKMPVLTISFIVYSAGIIAFGLYSTRLRKQTSDDFVLANRELGPWTSSLSASASAESGWVMLGLVGEAYALGLAAIWIIPGIAVGYLFKWFVIDGLSIPAIARRLNRLDAPLPPRCQMGRWTVLAVRTAL